MLENLTSTCEAPGCDRSSTTTPSCWRCERRRASVGPTSVPAVR
ncbi:hypothetical protein ACFQL0_08950 [Haloplanus litoreus]